MLSVGSTLATDFCFAASRLQLPPEFVRFMSSPELQEEIPSATACYFKLGKQFIRCPFGDGGYLLSFYHDQQDCLIWYIYVQNSGSRPHDLPFQWPLLTCYMLFPGEHAVVVSPYNLNELEGGTSPLLFCAWMSVLTEPMPLTRPGSSAC